MILSSSTAAPVSREYRPVSVPVIQRPPRRSHKQFARVIGRDRSTLIRNLNERSVIVHTTPPARVNNVSTSRDHRKHEQRGSRERTGNFHCKASSMVGLTYHV